MREREEKHRADADLTFDPDAAPVSFHYFSSDSQAEPGAAFTGGAADAGPAIRLKQLVAFGFGNARPLIADRKQLAAVMHPLRALRLQLQTEKI